MHSERAPWYLQLATWGGVVFPPLPAADHCHLCFIIRRMRPSAFSPQGLTLRWFAQAAGA